MKDIIKSFIVGTTALVSVIVLIGGIIRLAEWLSAHVQPALLIIIVGAIAMIYFAYQIGEEIRKWRD